MVRPPPVVSRASTVRNLMQRLHKTHCGCPMCSTGAQAAANSPLDILNAGNAIRSGGRSKVLTRAPLARGYATPVDAPQGDYAFEVAASNLRFGEGVTRVRPSPSSPPRPPPRSCRRPRPRRHPHNSPDHRPPLSLARKTVH